MVKETKQYGEGVETLKANKCSRCDYIWLQRGKTPPEVCPRCKSPYWAKAKVKNSGRFPKRENWK